MAQQPAPPPPHDFGRPRARPGAVTVSGVLLIVLGSVYLLFGVLLMLIVIAAESLVKDVFADVQGAEFAAQAALGTVVLIALVVLAFGTLDIIAGAKVFGLSSAWRLGGIVLTSIGSLLTLLGVMGSFWSGERLDPDTLQVVSAPSIGSLIATLILLALNIVALVLLARSGRFFVR
jgi:hypothetical protein